MLDYFGIVENPLQRIKIARWNGVELMIVALRACDGEAQESASCYIDAIVLELWSHGIHTEGRNQLGLAHEVAGEVRFDKLVIRHVLVKGRNDPIAVAV